jgi:hypothetical protein
MYVVDLVLGVKGARIGPISSPGHFFEGGGAEDSISVLEVNVD